MTTHTNVTQRLLSFVFLFSIFVPWVSDVLFLGFVRVFLFDFVLKNNCVVCCLLFITHTQYCHPHCIGTSVFNPRHYYNQYLPFVHSYHNLLLQQHRPVYIVSVDISKAFDRVPRQQILKIVRKLISKVLCVN